MKIGILISAESGYTNVEDLEDAARLGGHEVSRLFETKFSFVCDVAGNVQSFYEGRPFAGCEVIIYRSNFIEEPSLHLHVPQLLMRAGYRILNGSGDVALAKNKLVQHVRFSEARLPMPRWAIVRESAQALSMAQELGFPVIVKVAFGTHGAGVFYAENLETLNPIVDYLLVRDGNPLILEEFISEAERKDLRVFVVGGKIVAAMEREARSGDVRANASIGGKGSPVELSEEERRVVLRASEVSGLDILGVDVLRSKRGPLLVEINANPGFAELKRVTGVDVAGAIIDAAVQN